MQDRRSFLQLTPLALLGATPLALASEPKPKYGLKQVFLSASSTNSYIVVAVVATTTERGTSFSYTFRTADGYYFAVREDVLTSKDYFVPVDAQS